MEHGGREIVLSAVFSVAGQGEATACELHPDLVAAAGIKADGD